MTVARIEGRTSEAAALAAATLDDLLAAAGIDDDFFLLWPPLVLAALAADDLDLADRLLEPVASAPPGRISPRRRAVAAAARAGRGSTG